MGCTARMRLMCFLVLLVSLSVVSLAQAPDAADGGGKQGEASQQAKVHYIQKEVRVPAPEAFPGGLDVVEVYAERPGAHPVVLLTHGTSDKEEERRRVTPWSQMGQAMWFARRGYVVFVVTRSGYGRSGGERDTNGGGCGRNGSFERAGEASATDLRAVMRYAAELPEVDGATVVSAGVSTGGFAQVALAADPPKGLKAVINFAGGRGGDGHEHNCDLSGLVGSFGAFGRGARKHGALPTLWIYAENDHWFTPAMARQFEAAYTKNGGVEQFVLAPPNGDDGHHLYAHVSAWSETVEVFLKTQNLLPLNGVVLPAPEPPNVPPPSGLGNKGQEAWKRFLLDAPFRAFATNGQQAYGFAEGEFDQAAADAEAAERCKKAAGATANCAVVARTPGAK